MRVKHEQGVERCPKCEAYLSEVHPDLVAWYRRAKARFPAMHVSCGWRGKEAQAAALRNGTSRLRFPFSKHNAMDAGRPCSRAVDVFEIVRDGTAIFSMRFYHELASWSEAQGERVSHGVRWKSFADGPHVELKT